MLCRKMSKLKVFRVTGEIRKPNLKTPFKKEVLAAKPEHAVEKVYAEIGSKHRVKRHHMKILAVEEVSPEDIENPILKKMVAEE
jgi:large subunit ribosomal protein LX